MAKKKVEPPLTAAQVDEMIANRLQGIVDQLKQPVENAVDKEGHKLMTPEEPIDTTEGEESESELDDKAEDGMDPRMDGDEREDDTEKRNELSDFPESEKTKSLKVNKKDCSKEVMNDDVEGSDEAEDGDNMTGNTNSKEKSMPKLKTAERDELVDNLITNCDVWKHEGSEDILNNMSDAHLIGLNQQWLQEQEMINNDYAQSTGMQHGDEEGQSGDSNASLPESYEQPPKKGKPGGKKTGPVTEDRPDIESGRTGGGEGADAEQSGEQGGEHEYEGDRQAVDNVQAVEEWLYAVQAPDFVRNMVRDGLRADLELKANLIEQITSNKACPYTAEDLEAMTTNQLQPLAKFAQAVVPVRGMQAPITNGRSRIANYAGAQGAPVGNRRQKETPQEEMLQPTLNIDWRELAKENRDENR